jgi:hypothetical protein
MLSIQVVKGLVKLCLVKLCLVKLCLVKLWKRFPGLNSQYRRQCPYNLDESAPDSYGSWSEVTQAATA